MIIVTVFEWTIQFVFLP